MHLIKTGRCPMKRLISEKRHNEEILSQVATAVNHEINNPLMGIVGNLELALRDTKNDNVKGILRRALQDAFRIKDITRKLNNINKIVIKPYIGNSMMIDIDKSSQ